MPGTSTITRYKNVQEFTCGKCGKIVAQLGNFIFFIKSRIFGFGFGYTASNM